MFLPQNIDLSRSEKYVLSVRIKPDGFMFSISDPEDGKNYCLRETTFKTGDDLLNNVQRIIFDLNFLTQPFRQTNVVIVSKEYDLIPAGYYDRKKQKELYDFTHTNKYEHIISGLLEKQDMVILYNLQDELFSFLSRNLWNPSFFHHSQLTINVFEEKVRLSGKSSKMFISTHDKFTDILCFEGQNLRQFITYENETAFNLIYYILKIWEQSGFDQVNDYLYYSEKTDNAIIEKLSQYIRNIEKINAPSEIHFWSEDAQKSPLDLLSLSLPQ